MITEEELELIQWRATRGSHYAGTYIQGSKYAQHVVEEDVPRLLMEIHLLQKQIDTSGVGELVQAAENVYGLRDHMFSNGEMALKLAAAMIDLHNAAEKIRQGSASKPPQPEK